MGTRKVVAYIRVSTERQASAGSSLAAQKSAIAKWCESHGHGPITFLSDEGRSACSVDGRPQLAKALAAAVKGSIFVVTKLDRLARSTRDMLEIADRLKESGADLVSLGDSVDTTTPHGKFFFTLTSALGELERGLAQSRTNEVIAFRKANSMPVGPTPFGYKVEGEKLVAEPEEQAAIKVVERLRRQGMGTPSIARHMNESGRKHRSTEWRSENVRRVLIRCTLSPT